MKLAARRLAGVGTTLAVTMVLLAPNAWAVKPGERFRYGSLDCLATADTAWNGALSCTGTMNVTWRAKVKCYLGYTYYGPWQNNATGGTKESKTNSSCNFHVDDIIIDPI
ncbi:hypothetical protein [Streptomyces albireticuli]|uniref:Uncharacterized protein n=1 Tax=Streptomyces albireticuli TaxID=1940 RepID=A0A2A2DB23_9ACTN|nr:hypothetical protein [Streptomyces albireticuli]MCD9145464.1 hypothetical protein [Streptomyces albireticuli]MCD9164971.1 hypothetical protein [Streptomyces albireticuli]MCD9195438.1 hypothetical protein [Streptomyces albireticuli]PAU48724.1 hypothetical protein CK936_11785 [Streptomyces albireticuli]